MKRDSSLDSFSCRSGFTPDNQPAAAFGRAFGLSHARNVSGRRVTASCGFTLVEVLLSLALLVALLFALNTFIFSMGDLWGQNRQQRLFDQHVRAVTRYVGELLQRAALAPQSGHGLRVAPGAMLAAAGEPRLTFDLPAGDRLLPWPDHPLPDVQCALDLAPSRGLVLQWQSRWEIDFEKTPPRSAVLSPLVTRLDYDYYQAAASAWQTLPSPPPAQTSGQWQLPARLRLHFQYQKFSADTVVGVPAPSAALPAF
ncbi:MAG: hypothetical protein JWQ62_2112 [Lacunisphaera sp.]|nr:hypothetical protein [Lacunisphaera sp.]